MSTPPVANLPPERSDGRKIPVVYAPSLPVYTRNPGALLQATAVELNNWGWPALDYGENSMQAESVVLAVTAVDVFLDGKP